jgi:dienelactone hydrolase
LQVGHDDVLDLGGHQNIVAVVAGERPDWEWYERARDAVAAGDLDAAEQSAADALAAGHLIRVSLLLAPGLEPLRGRKRFEEIAAEARGRAAARNLAPRLLVEPARNRAGVAPLLLVLHGARGNAAEELDRWQSATGLGFIVAAAQSSQPATADGYCWDPPRDRIWKDLRAIVPELPAHGRTVLAGFSQGAWVALNLALEGTLIVSGSVIMVAPFAGPDTNLPPAWRRLKVTILVGEKDAYREPVERLAEQLKERGHHVSVDVIAGLGHAYPPDFEARLPALLRP